MDETLFVQFLNELKGITDGLITSITPTPPPPPPPAPVDDVLNLNALFISLDNNNSVGNPCFHAIFNANENADFNSFVGTFSGQTLNAGNATDLNAGAESLPTNVPGDLVVTPCSILPNATPVTLTIPVTVDSPYIHSLGVLREGTINIHSFKVNVGNGNTLQLNEIKLTEGYWVTAEKPSNTTTFNDQDIFKVLTNSPEPITSSMKVCIKPCYNGWTCGFFYNF